MQLILLVIGGWGPLVRVTKRNLLRLRGMARSHLFMYLSAVTGLCELIHLRQKPSIQLVSPSEIRLDEQEVCWEC